MVMKFTYQTNQKFNQNQTEICKFKENDNATWYDLCFGSVSKDFPKDEHIL